MATNKRRRLAIALAVSAAAGALVTPAVAQFTGGRAAFDQRPRAEPVQFRDFFRMPWGGGGYPAYPSYQAPQYNPFYPRQPVYEPTRPPPPRKVETPPSETILVIGDSLADWLGYGLEETFADTPEVGIVRKIKPTSGLIRYEGRADGPDWAQAVKDMLATEKPAAIVVMLGINDRLPLRERAPDKEKEKDKKGAATAPSTDSTAEPATTPDAEQPGSVVAAERDRRSPTGYYEFHSDKWAEHYEKRVDDMIAALKSKGVPVIWVGLPAVRGAKSTSDMSYLDELYRARAEKAGIVYVDPWDGFVDDKGQFVVQGPDFEGQIRRLRTGDGVNFTKAGAEKLARYAEHDLRRLLTSRAIPVALPGPEEQAPAKGNARPAIGPIVPLNVTSGGEGGDLLGAGGHAAQHESDPVATRVLSHGEAIAAPHGRADDFSWPRPDAGAAADLTSPPAATAPPEPAVKGATGKTEAKGEATKTDATKTDAKKSSEAKNDRAAPPANPASNAAAAKPRRTGTTLDGAPPRPPLPLGPSRN
jgi:uncharacterized protein